MPGRDRTAHGNGDGCPHDNRGRPIPFRAHVILCWLALPLIRIAETTTGDTWNQLREDLHELHIGTFEDPAGTFCQRTELTSAQRTILGKIGIDPPKKIIQLGLPTRS